MVKLYDSKRWSLPDIPLTPEQQASLYELQNARVEVSSPEKREADRRKLEEIVANLPSDYYLTPWWTSK